MASPNPSGNNKEILEAYQTLRAINHRRPKLLGVAIVEGASAAVISVANVIDNDPLRIIGATGVLTGLIMGLNIIRDHAPGEIQ